MGQLQQDGNVPSCMYVCAFLCVCTCVVSYMQISTPTTTTPLQLTIVHPPELENQLFNVDSENLNLGPRVLPTKQSLGPRVLFPISKTQTTATVSQAN